MDVGTWLSNLGLGQYEQAFRENDIDAEVVADLTSDDLSGLGITSIGHRRKLLAAIAALRAGSAPAASPSPEASAELAGTALPLSDAERRQLTVMFVDLVGSTALAARLDPEDMREIIGTYHRCVAETVDRFDGFVAKYMGDGVLVYFGYPQAHEDDAERAAHAGLSLVEAVGQLTSGGGSTLEVRIGIATGLVVVGDLVGEREAQERGVVGETPNLAARLQALASPGAVVVSENTRRLLGGLFDVADLGCCELKGFAEPMRIFQVLGEGRSESRFEALHATSLLPLVGREHELALFLDRWERARDGDGQAVLLTGEAGIGKSRLIRAFREQVIGRYTLLTLYGSQHYTNTALHPIVSWFERAAGFTRDDRPEQKLEKLEAVLSQAFDDIDEAMVLFASLLGIAAAERYPPSDLTPERLKERTVAVLLEHLKGLARKQPVLVLYEDAHWFDPSTLDLLARVVEQIEHLPVLAVVTARPGFSSPWAGATHITQLSLVRLRRSEGMELIGGILGGKALPGEVMDQIVAKSDGVPLFMEELTKAVLDAGLLVESGHQFKLAQPRAPLAIPATLHDSLMARLDRLGEIKQVAQVGAVIGREFSPDLLAATITMPEPQLAAALDRLIHGEIIFRRGVPPNASYAFKHTLLQDAAYQSLLKSRRQQLHARIAEVIAERFPGLVDAQPQVLAHHLTEAGLFESASEAWARVGLAALGRAAMKEAAAALERAVELLHRLPPSAERSRRELDWLSKLAIALTNTRGPASVEVEEVQRKVAALAEELGDRTALFRARWMLWRTTNVRADYEAAIVIGQELLDQATREGNVEFAVQAHHALWSSHLWRGDLQETYAHVDRALELYDLTRHGSDVMNYGGHDARECGLTEAGNALSIMGYPERAVALARAGLEHARTIGDPQVIAHALHAGLPTLQLAGELDELAGRIRWLLELAEQHALAMYGSLARILEAWLRVVQEGAPEAVETMQDHVDRQLRMGTALGQTLHDTLIADARLRLGQVEAAMAAAREGLARAERRGERLRLAELHRLTAACHLASSGHKAGAAEVALQAALAVARQQGARMWELRAGCDLARLWAEQGERQKGHELLAPVYGWFKEGFNTPDLKAAKVLLDELRT
jgi:class 3 adenylate cyclase/predicted ATPase